jgi:hypothetical protein
MVRIRQFLNVGVFVALIAANGLAASGAMSGQSIGVIANAIPSRFLPANWVFGIWSLIYLGLATCMLYQLRTTAPAVRATERLGWWWLASCVLNVAWISLFSFAQFAAALLIMIALLMVLVVLAHRLRSDVASAKPTVATLLCVQWPFDLYLAWISVALISNTFQFANVVGFQGFEIPESVWSVVMMAIASLLGVWMAWGKGMWLFPLVVAWAVLGIGVRYAQDPLIGSAALPIAATAILTGLGGWWLGRRGRRESASFA